MFAGHVSAPSCVEAQSPHQNSPTLKETLFWIQTSLEAGGGDYEVGHEVRSTRLEDFSGCKAHFAYSTHQEAFANGEPAPDKKPTRIDYFFNLGDIDPANLVFSRGPRFRLDAPAMVTIRTRNDEKKIKIKFDWQSEADAKPDNTYLIFTIDALENDYVDRFAQAFRHAVEVCGGKPSLFAESSQGANRQLSRNDDRNISGTRKDIPTIAKDAKGSIVSIVMSGREGKPIALGSGFCEPRGLIVTNYHVISEGSSAVAKFPNGLSICC